MADIVAWARAYGVKPIPAAHRALGTWDSFVLWADLGISFLVMVAGMFLVPGLGLGTALLAILVGALIGNILLGLAAVIGSDTGLPTMVLLRGALGLRGSYLPTVLNTLQLLGWATFEVIVMAQAANTLGTRLLGLPSSYHGWVLIFGALTLVLALGGPVVLVKQVLEKFVFWAVLATTLWITIALLTTYNLGTLLARPGTGALTFWLGVDLVVAMPISWFPLVADYSRFARTRRSAFWGTAAGYFVPNAWFYAVGALLALAGGVVVDPNAPVASLLAAIASLTAGWVALVALLADETDEGFANVYSTAVSLQNLFPQASQRALIIAVTGIVVVAAWFLPVTQYESFLLLIGSVFVPLLGLMTADYFILRGQRYDPEELFRPGGLYWYAGGFNWRALAAWALGFITYLAIAGLPPLGIPGLLPWLGASLPAFLVAFIVHLGLGRLAADRPLPRRAEV